MKIDIRRNKFGNMAVGLSAELDLDFIGPTDSLFTSEEKKAIDVSKDVLDTDIEEEDN